MSDVIRAKLKAATGALGLQVSNLWNCVQFSLGNKNNAALEKLPTESDPLLSFKHESLNGVAEFTHFTQQLSMIGFHETERQVEIKKGT